MPRWNMKRIAARLVVLLAAAGVVAAAYYLARRIPEPSSDFVLTPVRRGDLVVKTHFRGELRAVRSISLTAPNLGSVTQITKLAPSGALSAVGDLILELDDSERRAALEDAELEVERVGELLKEAETDLEIRKSQEEVELLKARFAVKRAELEVQKNELISAIDARKNVLTLEESKRREQKLEQDIQSRLRQREAELAVLREQLRKARLDADRERRRINQSRVLSPMSGLVAIQQNRAGGRGGFGQTTPDIQEGDQIPPGMEVVKILDLSEMEFLAKVAEIERSNLHEGQEAVILLDALPGKMVRARVRQLGNTASANVFRGEATKKFDCVLSIDMAQLLGHVGATPRQIERIMSKAQVGANPAASPAARAAAPTVGGARTAGPRGGDLPGADGPPRADLGTRPDGPRFRERRGGGAPGAAGAGFSDEQRQQARRMFQQMLGGRDVQSLSQQERQRMFRQMRQGMGGAARSGVSPGGGRGGVGGAKPGRPRAGGLGDPGGAGYSGPPESSGPAPALSLSLSRPGGQRFSGAQRDAAQLPEPPKAGSDADVLLRPGLLADAEIIVARIEDTLYIPYQGVFEAQDQSVVYLWDGSRLEARPVRLGKRSESQIAVLSGIEEGDLIALEPPDAGGRRARQKKAAERKKARPSLPGGGSPGGGRGRPR